MLTTELADGARWDELLTWPQDEKDLAAETIYRFAFGSLYRLRAFNGDPHPGNYLFHPGGRVTFLDFGLVKHFTQDELDDFDEMIQAHGARPRPGRVPRARSSASGCCRPGQPFTDEEVADYLGHFYEFVPRDGPLHHHPRVRRPRPCAASSTRRAPTPSHEGRQRAPVAS